VNVFPKTSCFSSARKRRKTGWKRGTTLCAICIYGTRDGNVIQRIAKPARGAGERGDHADVCALAGDAFLARRIAAKTDAMEKRYDARFQAVFETIRQMLATPIPAKKPIGFHAPSNCRQSPASPAVTNVNNRKQISYLPQGQLFGLEKTGHFGYTFVVVDSQKIPTNRHVHQGIQA
jgi:hypothetical protein